MSAWIQIRCDEELETPAENNTVEVPVGKDFIEYREELPNLDLLYSGSAQVEDVLTPFNAS